MFCVNLVGSPGCGKTTFLEALFARFPQALIPAVIEGDIAGQVDAERMEKIGVPVVQINTDGMCHLDASMIAAAAQGIELDQVNMLWIENVGNLVCTAGYDLGEHLRIVAPEHGGRGRQDHQVPDDLSAQRCAGDHQDRPAALSEFRRRGRRGPA